MRSIAFLLLAYILCNVSTNAVPLPSVDTIVLQSYRAIPGTNGIYLYNKTLSTRKDAEAACESDGTSLFFPKDEDEFNAVIQHFESKFENFPNTFHLGMRGSDHGYVTINGYTYFEPLGKCYKLQLTPKNWAKARIVCQEEESDLAVINSHEEAAFLVRLAKKVNFHVPGNFTRGVFHLGFHKQQVEDWQTIQGDSLTYSGYPCWGNRQPDGGDDEKCGSMFYNGHLNDIGCDREAFFICEHVIDDPYIISEPDALSINTECYNSV